MKPVARLRVVLVLAVFYVSGAAGLAKDIVAARLDARKDIIASETTSILRTNTFTGSHTTVWRSFEDSAIEVLCVVLINHIPDLGK